MQSASHPYAAMQVRPAPGGLGACVARAQPPGQPRTRRFAGMTSPADTRDARVIDVGGLIERGSATV
jgi:hypothetical protein